MSLGEVLNSITLEELRSYNTTRIEAIMKTHGIPIRESKGNKTQLISRILAVTEMLNIKFKPMDQSKELDLGTIDIFGSE